MKLILKKLHFVRTILSISFRPMSMPFSSILFCPYMVADELVRTKLSVPIRPQSVFRSPSYTPGLNESPIADRESSNDYASFQRVSIRRMYLFFSILETSGVLVSWLSMASSAFPY